MKPHRLFSAMLIFTVLLAVGCKKDSPTGPMPETHAGLYLSPATGTVSAGNPFDLVVNVGALPDSVFALTFQLQFLDSVLAYSELAGIVAGDFFGYEAVVFASESAGRLHVAVSRTQGQSPVAGSGSICTLRFIAQSAGTCSLAVLPDWVHYHAASGTEVDSLQTDTVRAVVTVN